MARNVICTPYAQFPLSGTCRAPHSTLAEVCWSGAGLIDFGQSKQLSEEQRLAFARLVIALSKADGAELLDVVKALDVPQQEAISQGLQDIGIK